MSPERIEKEIREQTKELPGEPGDPEARRPLRARLLPAGAPGRLPRRQRRARLRAQLPAGLRSPRTSSATSARSPPSSSKSRATRASRPATRSARPGSSTPTTTCCAGINGATRVQVDALGLPTGGRSASDEPRRPATTCASRSTPRSRRPARRRSASSACPAASSRWTSTAARSSALGSQPDLRPLDLHASRRSRRRPYSSFLNSEDTGAPLANRAIQGLYPTGSTFKLITATAALEEGLITPSEIVNDPARSRSAASPSRTRATRVNGADRHAHGAPGLLRRLLLQARPRGGRRRAATPIQEWATKLGLGEPDRDRPARASRRA